MAPDNVIIISYWPGYDQTKENRTPHNIPVIDAQEIMGIIRKLDEEYGGGQASACLWTTDNSPLLVLPDADTIIPTLITWAENDPASWFEAIIYSRPASQRDYVVMLMPNIDKSIARYKLAWLIHEEEIIGPNTKYVVAFKPIIFGTKNSAIFTAIAGTISPVGATIDVGIIDTKWIDMENPFNLERASGHIYHLHLRRGDHTKHLTYLTEFLVGLVPPTRQTRISPES